MDGSDDEKVVPVPHFYRVVSSVNIQFTMIGIIIGISAPLRNALFFDFTALTPVGSTIQTMIAGAGLDFLIMAATLASVDVTQFDCDAREAMERRRARRRVRGHERGPGAHHVCAARVELVKKGGSNARPRVVVVVATEVWRWGGLPGSHRSFVAATPGSLRGTSR